MKLATLKDGSRDGALIIVDRLGTRYVAASHIAANLQSALDRWQVAEQPLLALSKKLETSASIGQPLDVTKLHSPLPRAYEWVDGSAYINHIVLVRKSRNAEPPETLRTEPLVYQGGSGVFIGPTDNIPLGDKAWGLDFESEVCVILDDVPMGTTKEEAGKHIKLVMLANDVSLRGLIPAELAKGFGFFQSKPATAFSPFAVTPDELGDSWQGGRLHLPLKTIYNDQLFGDPNAGPEMFFGFHELIAHLAKTRSYTAGTILGSGTVSNEDRARGSSCLAEKRCIEQIDHGKITTPFMDVGDRIEIEMFGSDGVSIFGRIKQKVVPFTKAH